MLLDIHTHRLPADASAALLSCCMRDVPLPEGARFISAGIHPWYLTREDYPRQLEWVVSMLNDRRVIALGEAGLDKRCDTPFDLQVEAFQATSIGDIFIDRTGEQIHILLHDTDIAPQAL